MIFLPSNLRHWTLNVLSVSNNAVAQKFWKLCRTECGIVPAVKRGLVCSQGFGKNLSIFSPYLPVIDQLTIQSQIPLLLKAELDLPENAHRYLRAFSAVYKFSV